MENVELFLNVSSGYGDGDGYGYGDGYGSGLGSGSGSGYGYGDGYGDGSGYGDGYGSGSGLGSGSGSGSGSGLGSGSGYGSGDGSGLGINSFNNHKAHPIDGIATIIYSLKGSVAKAAMINADLTLTECYIVRVGDSFAHGETIQKATEDARKKHIESIPVEQRISEFNKSFPSKKEQYKTSDFYEWHSILTGSCSMGKEMFVKENGIDLNGQMTVMEFVTLTKDNYGGEIIEKLI